MERKVEEMKRKEEEMKRKEEEVKQKKEEKKLKQARLQCAEVDLKDLMVESWLAMIGHVQKKKKKTNAMK